MPAQPDSTQIGFVGLGIMGAPMALHLIEAGFSLKVYNRTDRPRVQQVVDAGGQRVDTPKAAAEDSDVVITIVTDTPHVEDVILGEDGVIHSVKKGATVIDMSTISPRVTQQIAATLKEKGANMLDAPVSGGDVGAIEGTLSIMVGGKEELFERCLPVFRAMGRRITLMGERVGAGGYAKLANQIMVATHLASMGEALVFGAKAGLDLTQLEEALSGGAANSEILRLKASKVLSGEFTPGARSTVQVKDLDYIADSMEALGFSLPVVQLVGTLYRELIDMGHGEEDHSAIVRVFEKLAGVEARA